MNPFETFAKVNGPLSHFFRIMVDIKMSSHYSGIILGRDENVSPETSTVDRRPLTFSTGRRRPLSFSTGRRRPD